MPYDDYLGPREIHIYCRENHFNLDDIRGLTLRRTMYWGYETMGPREVLETLEGILWYGCTPYREYTRDQCLQELADISAESLDELFRNLQRNPNI